MGTYRLNLSALRRGTTHPRQTPTERLVVSRREVLGLAGAAAIGLSPVARAVEASVTGPFECVVRPGRAAFKLAGADRWVLDTRRFAGSPALDVTRTDSLIKIKLSNARYPGTDLPADMTCDIRRGVVGWRMTIRMKLGGFRADVPFDRWLAGREEARSAVRLNNLVCELGAHGGVTLDGQAEAVLSPDWTLTLHGRNIASLELDGKQTPADALAISLLGKSDASLVTKPAPNRSLVVLRPGKSSWDRDLFLSRIPETWGRSIERCAFDTITLELGEHKTGLPQRTLLAESLGDATRLSVNPMNLDRFSLPLRNIRYSSTFGKSDDHSALLASFGSEAAWLRVDGCSLQLGDAPHADDLEITQTGARKPSVSCAPALLAIAAPLIGAVTSTARPTKPTNVDVTGKPPATTRRVPNAAERKAPTAPDTRRPDAKVEKPPVRVIKPDQGNVIVKPNVEAEKIKVTTPFNLRVQVVRPSDLLCLEFEFVNLKYVTGNPPSLVRNDAKAPAYIIVHFPPQNLAERAYFEADKPSSFTENPDPPPIPIVMAGGSRLVFRVPSNTNELPYKLDVLLDWRRYEPSLVPVAKPPSDLHISHTAALSPATASYEINKDLFAQGGKRRARPKAQFNSAAVAAVAQSMLVIKEPEATDTSIEAPYRLMMSPHAWEGWAHSPSAVTANGRTELWHTRLAMRTAEGDLDESESPYKTLRAVWSPDYDPKNPPKATDLTPFRTSMTSNDRYQIVGLTSNFQTSGYEPVPVHAKNFMLSSLGAWIDTHGVWDPRKLQLDVCEWKHTATMGRDHYVKVVKLGYLFPYGHLAVKTEITERKFQQVGKRIGAYLRKRMFITVLKPVVEYPIPYESNMEQEIPFQRIECVTMVTPNLEPAENSAISGKDVDAFWPTLGNDVFKFHMIAEDWEGRHSEFETPVIWIANSSSFKQGPLSIVSIDYHSDKSKDRRRIDFRGQRIAYAEPDKPGDTSYETQSMNLMDRVPASLFGNQAVIDELTSKYIPPFYPYMLNADVKIVAVQQLLGNDAPATVQYPVSYKMNGMAAKNKGQVFLELKNPVGLDFGGSPDKSCGVVAPSIGISAISRGFGAVGGVPSEFADGKFDPLSFFKDAMVFGTIPLTSILDKIEDFGSLQSAGLKIPQLKNTPIYESGKSMPSAIETSFAWETSSVHNDTVTETFLASANGQQASLALSAVKRTALDGGESTQVISGELRNFTIQLVPKIMHLADIVFNYIRFSCESGKKPDVKADIDKMVFRGVLEFINPLEEFLGGNGFSDPPFLDVTSEHVRAGFTLPIPTVGIGVFTLQNINLGAALTVPFIGQPVSMRFNFCERQDPFMLSVSMYTGGGYFALEIDPDGVRKVEGALEFGGAFALNLGVASGGVYVMAGVMFSKSTTETRLGGYLRCGGALEVLGLITVSLEFWMSLEHVDKPKSHLHGIATVTVEVEVAFFSKSVHLTVERDFGGGGDPLFKDLMEPSDWDEYCEAFAA